jgi:CBS domain-containing protein
LPGQAKIVAGFLAGLPAFADVPFERLVDLATSVTVVDFPSGAVLFDQGAHLTQVLVVAAGSVNLVLGGRVIAVVQVSQLVGHDALAGQAARVTAVAAQDTQCYRLPVSVTSVVLGQPAGIRFLVRSVLADPVPRRLDVDPVVDAAHRPAGDLVRSEPVICHPEMPLRAVAEELSKTAATCAVVLTGSGQIGIFTDRDFRERVIACGVSAETPIADLMTFPAYTVQADRMASEVMLDMLEWGVRHAPVMTPDGRVVGVLEDIDLLSSPPRSSFHLRAAIARAKNVTDLAGVGAQLKSSVLALQDARVASVDIAGIHSVVVDAITRRVLELTVDELGAPEVPFTWMVLGSVARREAVPSSDVDSALVWYGSADAQVQAHLRAIASRVVEALASCGFPADTNGATATSPRFARSAQQWKRAVRHWLDDPTTDGESLMMSSLLVDGRPIWGTQNGPALSTLFRGAGRHPAFLRLLARQALSHRPRTPVFREFAVRRSDGTLDVKSDGLLPVVNLARWAGMVAQVTSASTPARLRAAAEAGVITDEDCRTLTEAFNLFLQLRLEHQVHQLRADQQPDDLLRPDHLDHLSRTTLKEAFRAVAAIQRRVSSQLDLEVS